MKSSRFGPGVSLFMMSTPPKPITVCVSSQPLASLLDQMCFFFYSSLFCLSFYYFYLHIVSIATIYNILISFWPRVEGCSCVRLRAVSLFSWSVEQNARDTQMTTHVTEGARRVRHDALFFLLGLPPSFLASRGFAAQRSRACALPLLNLRKKRECSQSTHVCAKPFGDACKYKSINQSIKD